MTKKNRAPKRRNVAPPEPTSEELHADAVHNDTKRIRGHYLAEYIGVGLILISGIATFLIGRYALSDASGLPAYVAWSVILLCACIPLGLIMQNLHSDSTRGLLEDRISLSSMSMDVLKGIKEGLHDFLVEHMDDYNAESGKIDMASEIYRGVKVKSDLIQHTKDTILKAFTELGFRGSIQAIKDLPARARFVTEMVDLQAREYEDLPASAELATETTKLSNSLDTLREVKAANEHGHPAE